MLPSDHYIALVEKQLQAFAEQKAEAILQARAFDGAQEVPVAPLKKILLLPENKANLINYVKRAYRNEFFAKAMQNVFGGTTFIDLMMGLKDNPEFIRYMAAVMAGAGLVEYASTYVANVNARLVNQDYFKQLTDGLRRIAKDLYHPSANALNELSKAEKIADKALLTLAMFVESQLINSQENSESRKALYSVTKKPVAAAALASLSRDQFYDEVPLAGVRSLLEKHKDKFDQFYQHDIPHATRLTILSGIAGSAQIGECLIFIEGIKLMYDRWVKDHKNDFPRLLLQANSRVDASNTLEKLELNTIMDGTNYELAVVFMERFGNALGYFHSQTNIQDKITVLNDLAEAVKKQPAEKRCEQALIDFCEIMKDTYEDILNPRSNSTSPVSNSGSPMTQSAVVNFK